MDFIPGDSVSSWSGVDPQNVFVFPPPPGYSGYFWCFQSSPGIWFVVEEWLYNIP